MKNRAADARPRLMGEPGFGCVTTLDEADPCNRHALGSAQLDSQLAKSFQSVRHQALAATLVDYCRRSYRRRNTFDDRDAEALPARGDAGRQPRGSTTGDGNVGSYHRNKTSSEQNPGPMAARRP